LVEHFGSLQIVIHYGQSPIGQASSGHFIVQSGFEQVTSHLEDPVYLHDWEHLAGSHTGSHLARYIFSTWTVRLVTFPLTIRMTL
jgi:hypothetical protein